MEKTQSPWDAKFISLLRLRDWLRVLGFELNGGSFGRYAPPFRDKLWLDRFQFMEQAGARWWPIAGGIYVVRAVKRVHGMRVVTPAWRRERRAGARSRRSRRDRTKKSMSEPIVEVYSDGACRGNPVRRLGVLLRAKGLEKELWGARRTRPTTAWSSPR